MDLHNYNKDLIKLYNKLKLFNFDCIVALKRSGWICGVFLSNQFDIPLYSSSELKTIPLKFKKVLLVDDKICTGKSITKIKNRLLNKYKFDNVVTACLYVKDCKYPDFYIKDKVNKRKHMWYEVKLNKVA